MTYPGGKSGAGVYQRIINLIPPHRVYIEAFVGGGAILRHKRPADVSIAIDADARALLDLESLELPMDTITFINADAISFLREYAWRGDEFVYCDPPYLMSTRRSGSLYRHEMTDDQHLDLLSIILTMPAAVMISGYPSELYNRHLCGWSIEKYRAVTRGGSMADERLWMNYNPPALLHDDQYLGHNFRERERIKRKRNRWANRFRRLPIQERGAIFRDLAEVVRGSAIAGIGGAVVSPEVVGRSPSLDTSMPNRAGIDNYDDSRPSTSPPMTAGTDRHE